MSRRSRIHFGLSSTDRPDRKLNTVYALREIRLTKLVLDVVFFFISIKFDREHFDKLSRVFYE